MSAADRSPADVVTIDGPNGVGKTAVARGLAARLGRRWVSAGLVYRALAVAGADCDVVPRLTFDLADDGVLDPVVEVGALRFGEDDPRIASAGPAAAQIATRPQVRAAVSRCVTAAAEDPIVVEGRTMYDLFPDSAVRVYLYADRAERDRRVRAIGGTGLDLGREQADSRRSLEPLRVRAGSLVWDSTRYSLAQTVELLGRRVALAAGEPVEVRVPVGTGAQAHEVGALLGRPVRLVVDHADDPSTATPPDLVVGYPADAARLAAHVRVMLAGNDVVSVDLGEQDGVLHRLAAAAAFSPTGVLGPRWLAATRWAVTGDVALLGDPGPALAAGARIVLLCGDGEGGGDARRRAEDQRFEEELDSLRADPGHEVLVRSGAQALRAVTAGGPDWVRLRTDDVSAGVRTGPD